jgi:branched-chain amino acid transport system ATP-binding protein
MTTVLSVQQLSKGFNGVHALEGLDVDVRESEILGLVGPNGSGKTTLFNCVTGFVRPTAGGIIWQGDDITSLAPDQIARLGVVRTFQQKMVFPRATVQENLVMAWRRRPDDTNSPTFSDCGDLLQFLGLDQFEEKFAGDIPFGSARKLGLGLALAACPQLLLLDEPAAGLNQDESHELGELIKKMSDLGITVWVIEHDMPLLMSICHRVVVLDAGRKIAEGKPAEIATDPAVISVYLGEKFAKDTRA